MAKKMTASSAIKQINDDFDQDEKLRREIHEATMEGLVEPLIQQGLVDDVEPDFTREELGACPLCDATLRPDGSCYFCPEMSVEEQEIW